MKRVNTGKHIDRDKERERERREIKELYYKYFIWIRVLLFYLLTKLSFKISCYSFVIWDFFHFDILSYLP